MYTNSPNLNLYRIAELRRREDLVTAADRRRHQLLAGAGDSRLVRLRLRLGALLIALGNRVMQAPASHPRVEQCATG